MDVRICGPNLNDQSKGSFHVHADGCADLKRYGPGRKLGGYQYGEHEVIVQNATVLSVVREVYADQIAENPDAESEMDMYVNDFWFAPCCSDIDTEEIGESLPADPVVFECWAQGTFVKLESLTEVQAWITEILPSLGVHDHLNVVPHRASEYSH